jgi:hypothetical protein
MIKNTNAYCQIKSIKIAGYKAYITLHIYSNEPATINKSFEIWLSDNDNMYKVSPYVYWIDRAANYLTNTLNVDINMSKEIDIEIDIRNDGLSNIVGNRWVRNCKIILVDITDRSKKINSWLSETLELISKPITLPRITELNIATKKDYKELAIDFKYKYPKQDDENFNNQNIYTIVNLISHSTKQIIESSRVLTYEDIVNGKLSYTFKKPIENNDYFNDYVIVEVKVYTIKNSAVISLRKLYKPYLTKTTAYIKRHGTVVKVESTYIKKDVGKYNDHRGFNQFEFKMEGPETPSIQQDSENLYLYHLTRQDLPENLRFVFLLIYIVTSSSDLYITTTQEAILDLSPYLAFAEDSKLEFKVVPVFRIYGYECVGDEVTVTYIHNPVDEDNFVDEENIVG